MAIGPRPVSRRRPTRPATRLLYPLRIAAIAVVALVVYTVIQGEGRLPFGDGLVFAFGKAESEEPLAQPSGRPVGTVPVLACPRVLPAFTKITREHLLTDEGLHTVPVVEPAIQPNGLFPADNAGVQRLLGRVLKREKPVNFAFSENDLLPPGTRAGTTAGIPPGKRGVWLDLERVQGLSDVQPGDYVDLVAAKTMDAPPAPDLKVMENLSDPILRARMQRAAVMRKPTTQTRSWVIARQALVVTPVRLREINTGEVSRAKPPKVVEEVFVAMAPEEVSNFSQALAQEVALVAAPRSGQPEDEGVEIQDVTPPDPNADLRRLLLGGDEEPMVNMIEVIRGNQRQTVTVPRAK
ncbi:MAG: hypothetical protein VYE77_10105 [Planctomycetota bacterium]|nr:hypothetical protein [Planctomycetota bacterium]